MRAVCMIALVWLLSACAVTQRTGESARQSSIAAATNAWREAYDSRDAGRIVAMYAPDAVLWGTTAKKIAATPAAINDYFKDAARRPTARVNFTEQHIRVYGDVAVNSGNYTFSEVRNGAAVSRPARFTMVFRLQQGTWLLAAHHSSEVP